MASITLAAVAGRGRKLLLSGSCDRCPRFALLNMAGRLPEDMQHMSRTALDLEQRRSPTVRLGGSGTAHEIAAAAALLLSDDASYITRRVLGVAGGWGAGEFGGDGVQFGAPVTVCDPEVAFRHRR